jgi:hypothetical protein
VRTSRFSTTTLLERIQKEETYMPWKNAILKEIRRPYDAITLKNYEA